ncbi:MAG: hypothetical protein HC843_12610 [Sphingomonadales bacterium]|nr:hypothetical protein [Sphingomonadales bacterium]
MGIGLGLKLLGIGKKIGGWIVGGIAWLFDDWRRLAGLAVILAFAFFVLQNRSLRSDLVDQVAATAKEAKRADAAEIDFDQLKQQHYSFVADVQAKTAEAERLDRENAARVDREMITIRERTAHEYEVRLSDTRNALDQLRQRIADASAGSEGHGDGTDMSDAYAARCKAFGFADCDTLLAALPELLAAAEENTATLIELQNWVRSTLAIDLDGNVDPPPD